MGKRVRQPDPCRLGSRRYSRLGSLRYHRGVGDRCALA